MGGGWTSDVNSTDPRYPSDSRWGPTLYKRIKEGEYVNPRRFRHQPRLVRGSTLRTLGTGRTPDGEDTHRRRLWVVVGTKDLHERCQTGHGYWDRDGVGSLYYGPTHVSEYGP